MRFPFAGVTRDENGAIIVAATIEIYETASVVPASVYTASAGGVHVHSVTSDINGVFLFFIDGTEYSLGQLFKLIIYKGTSTPRTYDPIAVPMYSPGAAVIAPPWNTDGYIPLWNGTDSAALKDGVMLDTDGTLAANSDTRVASQKAGKTYADTKIPTSYLDTDGTLTADSDVKVASQKATKTYSDTKIASSALDTDGTLAANSDVKVASQKATKTYADTKVAKTLYDANSILAANADDTPVAVTVAGHRLLGRITGSNIAALTSPEVMSILLGSTVAGDMSYFSATNVIARIPKAASGNYKLFQNIGLTSPEWAIGMGVIYATRDMTLASGNVTISVGFQPAGVIAIACMAGGASTAWSVGMQTVDNYKAVIYNSANTNTVSGATGVASIFTNDGVSCGQLAYVYGWGTTSIVLAWTKYGSPTGTAIIDLFCWR